MKNGVMMQYFEWNLPNDGTLWNKLKADAAHLHDIGITAVWIPPAYKADEQQDEGYATYDLYDLGEFDQKNTVRTKYGTKAQLQSMIDELHKQQISVYLDTVMNHKSGGDYTERFMVEEVDPVDRDKAITDPHEIQGWTGYLFHGRGNKYSDFKWNWSHFSGTGFDDAARRSGIFRVIGENKYWSEGVDKENGNYDFLLANDLDLDHPEVIAELNRWGIWVSGELGLDGMRLDAIKHMEAQFVKQFLESVRAEKGDGFYAVGEYWNGDFDTLDSYIEAVDGKIDLFDVPLHYQFYAASQQEENFDLQTLFTDTLVAKHPELAVTFVDNHDTQVGSSLESHVDDWFKPLAYGLIFLMEKGYPCLFYGDYYGVKGEKSPHGPIIDRLLDIRRNYAYGEQVDYFDDPHIVGFLRRGDKEHGGLVYLISNKDNGSKTMQVGVEHAGETWHELTGSIQDTVLIDKNGEGTFTVNGRNLAVWAKE